MNTGKSKDMPCKTNLSAKRVQIEYYRIHERRGDMRKSLRQDLSDSLDLDLDMRMET